jgi:hypothetical protein
MGKMKSYKTLEISLDMWQYRRNKFGPLMKQLEKRVLTIRPRLTKDNGAGLISIQRISPWRLVVRWGGIRKEVSSARYRLAIRLHKELLQISSESVKILIVSGGSV